MTMTSDWKIIFIDDEEDIRDITNFTLEDAGYDVITAPNGETGLRLCEEILPQIVITDIRMPGMDGLQVLECLKDRHPDIEVIVATAFGEMNLAVRALQLDASDFITKPINVETLYLALDRAKARYTSRKQLIDYTSLLEKEHAKTSQELVKNFMYQKNLIESSMDGILGCDEKDIVVTFNKSIEQMLGYSKNEVIRNIPMSQFFIPGEADRLRAELKGEKYGGKGRLFLYETGLLAKKGRQIPVQVSASLLYDQEKESGSVFYFRDLREIRKLEREMEDQARILHQDKMMSLGRLAASVVHEINNPLSGILNYLRLMTRILNRGPLKENHREKFQEYLDLVEKETSRCSNIISSLLTFSRKSSPSFEQVNIEELLNRCVILSKHKLDMSSISLVFSVNPKTPLAFGDLNQLQQCIINLIFNAIDAMPGGGTLTLEGGCDAADDRVIIIVKDSGAGISQDNLSHIFEPFFTTKKEGYGVGLGLSTVFGIIERHKGDINVESSPGAGTVFKIQLPVFKSDMR